MPDEPDVERLAETVLASLCSTPPAVVRALGCGLEFSEHRGISQLGHALGDVPDDGPDAVSRLRLQAALKMLALDPDPLLARIEDATDAPWRELREALVELSAG